MYYEIYRNTPGYCHYEAMIQINMNLTGSGIRYDAIMPDKSIIDAVSPAYVLARAIDDLFGHDNDQYKRGFKIRNDYKDLYFVAVPYTAKDGDMIRYEIRHHRNPMDKIETRFDTCGASLVKACEWIV